MKENEVPQDKGAFVDLYYAIDEDGNFVTKKSDGWEPKKVALEKSLELIAERVNEIHDKVLQGEVSPIVYYMELNRMDLGVLSAYYGKWSWIVKRHFKPGVFKKLSKKALQKYARIFDISVEELTDIEKYKGAESKK